MKLCLLAIVGLLTAAATSSIATKHYQSVLGNNDQDLYLVELGPGQTRWIAEEEKWALRRVCSYHCHWRTNSCCDMGRFALELTEDADITPI